MSRVIKHETGVENVYSIAWLERDYLNDPSAPQAAHYTRLVKQQIEACLEADPKFLERGNVRINLHQGGQPGQLVSDVRGGKGR